MSKSTPTEDPAITQTVAQTATARPRGRPARSAPPVASDSVLLGRAFELFAERGYEGTAMRDVARQLGVSHNLLRLRFGSKEDIWRRAVDERVEQTSGAVLAAFVEDLPPVERLSLLIQRFCRSVVEDPAVVGMINNEGRRESERLDHLFAAYIAPFEAQLRPLLAAVAADPEEPLPTTVFMSLLVNGAGSYFASGPLFRRIEPEDGRTLEMRIAPFASALVAAAVGHDHLPKATLPKDRR